MQNTLYLFIGLVSGIVPTVLFLTYIYQRKHTRIIQEKDIEIQNERETRIRIESRLEEQQKAFEEARKNLKDTFDASATSALKSNNQVFLDLAKKTLESYMIDSKADLSKRQESIEKVIKPLADSLNKHEELIGNLRESSQKTFGNIQTYLTELKGSQEKLSLETNALVNALKNPRVRGKWGEIGLRRIVEFSGLTEHCDFTEQESVTVEDGRLRPDMVVNLPENRKVIVDSKIPLNAYLEALECQSEEDREKLLHKHAKDVREHMNKLSRKEYWSQFTETVDFVVLYMELEPAFGAAVERDRNLILDGINNRIIFATPTTLVTLLRTIAYSWKQQAITDNANEIWKVGTEIHERLTVFAKHLMNVGKGLESATKYYNSAVGSWESRIVPGTKKLGELGAAKDPDKLPESKVIETAIRKSLAE